ncbi:MULTISPECIES: DUF3365 domain-containing protein [unclassified Sinorhizobium]|uniref:Tll0287-like domain-containing protein n=1 Tax=unclassified Sinorhizobium TaxID=2613772 RepID=UPI003523B60A
MYRVVACCVILTALASLVAADEDDVATGERLAAFLRAGRSVISSHQKLINDASIGKKNLTGQRVVDEALVLYRESKAVPPSTAGLSELDKQLFDAQVEAMREIVDEQQEVIDAKGVGFKGLIPATFGRLVNERFEEKVGNLARMKVTAPEELVRNRKARPDEWEQHVIDSKFLAAGWPKGQPFVEEVDVEGRKSFRMLIPEYYSASCLTCHGQPKGEVDITGYPKEGAAEGDLAGAISITLFK